MSTLEKELRTKNSFRSTVKTNIKQEKILRVISDGCERTKRNYALQFGNVKLLRTPVTGVFARCTKLRNTTSLIVFPT